ncbi:hypothetical protein PSI9734_02338 [Pseudidiomarina piscicola]|uniref:Uncharacterized protein n=1 Tax=Pseudidiomarina piscicola TaxID=2614830 RepID=A0A6S6WQ57_9GAMM|nr:hypothetical protein PSI9734_02338 [Pseudidiomarina piscicola]VZT41429.1 hypothetical protein PSI9734_02338 [Pseudomonas aeruginosa]
MFAVRCLKKIKQTSLLIFCPNEHPTSNIEHRSSSLSLTNIEHQTSNIAFVFGPNEHQTANIKQRFSSLRAARSAYEQRTAQRTTNALRSTAYDQRSSSSALTPFQTYKIYPRLGTWCWSSFQLIDALSVDTGLRTYWYYRAGRYRILRRA